jgi:hypothetical protein
MFLMAVQIMLSNVRADTTRALRMFYDGFFSAHIAPNTIEAAACLSNGKLAFFKRNEANSFEAR